jgi:hypothetical protein
MSKQHPRAIINESQNPLMSFHTIYGLSKSFIDRKRNRIYINVKTPGCDRRGSVSSESSNFSLQSKSLCWWLIEIRTRSIQLKFVIMAVNLTPPIIEPRYYSHCLIGAQLKWMAITENWQWPSAYRKDINSILRRESNDTAPHASYSFEPEPSDFYLSD